MKNLRNLKGDGIRNAIKGGKTIDDLCRDYGCDIISLEKKIRQIYYLNPDIAEKRLQQLKDNEISEEQPENEPRATTDVEASSILGPFLMSLPRNQVSNQAGIPSASNVPSEVASADEQAELDELERKEKVLRDEIIELETQHKGFMQEHRNGRKKLTALLDDAKRRYQEFLAYDEKSRQVIEEVNQIATKINQTTDRRKEKLAELEEIRRQIEARKTVSLHVYKDGHIEVSDDPDFVINDEGHLELRQKLMEREECLDLRMRDIYTLARLSKIIEHSERSINVIFESIDLEKAYDCLR